MRVYGRLSIPSPLTIEKKKRRTFRSAIFHQFRHKFKRQGKKEGNIRYSYIIL